MERSKLQTQDEPGISFHATSGHRLEMSKLESPGKELFEIMRVRRLEFEGMQSLNLFSSNMNHAGMEL
jgi:hypothetical protein